MPKLLDVGGWGFGRGTGTSRPMPRCGRALWYRGMYASRTASRWQRFSVALSAAAAIRAAWPVGECDQAACRYSWTGPPRISNRHRDQVAVDHPHDHRPPATDAG